MEKKYCIMKKIIGGGGQKWALIRDLSLTDVQKRRAVFSGRALYSC